ncbi:MAG: hypothetical protein CVU44_16180 [Chloroflexi bacterium HGW-Chloroflexi-6]|nr:MAG: hypothetical protein CVU44_16180 [Chloroflexi bacterium HGW-Chloroflexi-6]
METSLDFTHLALVAFLVEAIIQTIKPIYDKETGWKLDKVVSIIVGIVVCVATNVDLFAELGFVVAVPFLGSILTGIIASRGSNVVHDVFKFVQGKAEQQKQDIEGVG